MSHITKLPLELTRIICEELVANEEDQEALSTETARKLSQLRLISPAFATAGAEQLFHRIYCQARADDWECSSLQSIAGSEWLRSHVREVELRLDLRQNSSSAPCVPPGRLTDFRRFLSQIRNTLPKFQNVRKMLLTIVGHHGDFVPGYVDFCSQWLQEIGSLSRVLPRLEALDYVGPRVLSSWVITMVQEDMKYRLKDLAMSLVARDEPDYIEDEFDETFDNDNEPKEIISFTEEMPLLENLYIDGDGGYPSGLEIIIKQSGNFRLPALKQMCLAELAFQTEDGLAKLIEGSPQLESVTLSYLNENGVWHDRPIWGRAYGALSSLEHLKTLKVTGSRGLDDLFDFDIPFQGSLEELCLMRGHFCAQFLVYLINNNKESLRHLHLDGLRMFEGRFAEVVIATKECPHLLQFCLDGNVDSHHFDVGATKEYAKAYTERERILKLNKRLPTIREDWKFSRMAIDYNGKDGEALFHIGEVLRGVITRGGNETKCAEVRSFGYPVYDQEGVASLYPWAAIRDGLAQPTDVYEWDRNTGQALMINNLDNADVDEEEAWEGFAD